jgi:hypothetical protein
MEPYLFCTLDGFEVETGGNAADGELDSSVRTSQRVVVSKFYIMASFQPPWLSFLFFILISITPAIKTLKPLHFSPLLLL